ncbi:hypothetical protein PR048_017776 [Dryococelus australis]|uniref:Uncharacterized protein n=1 Tax=Dryococelus australis TaxID=614101 RepID=A0ABQ9HAG9_9NEOP|nr:hypothetical protein PR048_017776 [Dryococelus australis]
MFWELGRPAQRASYRKFWVMAYDTIYTAAVQRPAVFGEGYLAECERAKSDVNDDRRLRDDGGRGVCGMNGREGVQREQGHGNVAPPRQSGNKPRGQFANKRKYCKRPPYLRPPKSRARVFYIQSTTGQHGPADGVSSAVALLFSRSLKVIGSNSRSLEVIGSKSRSPAPNMAATMAGSTKVADWVLVRGEMVNLRIKEYVTLSEDYEASLAAGEEAQILVRFASSHHFRVTSRCPTCRKSSVSQCQKELPTPEVWSRRTQGKLPPTKSNDRHVFHLWQTRWTLPATGGFSPGAPGCPITVFCHLSIARSDSISLVRENGGLTSKDSRVSKSPACQSHTLLFDTCSHRLPFRWSLVAFYRSELSHSFIHPFLLKLPARRSAVIFIASHLTIWKVHRTSRRAERTMSSHTELEIVAGAREPSGISVDPSSEMSTVQHKAQSVLWFTEFKVVVTVQHNFRQLYPGQHFFFWGYVDDIGYAVKIRDLQHLHQIITAAIETTRPTVLRNTWMEVEYRLDICKATNGAQT